MVGNGANAFPNQDYLGWILEWLAIFHIGTARQGTYGPFSQEGSRMHVEDKVKIVTSGPAQIRFSWALFSLYVTLVKLFNGF